MIGFSSMRWRWPATHENGSGSQQASQYLMSRLAILSLHLQMGISHHRKAEDRCFPRSIEFRLAALSIVHGEIFSPGISPPSPGRMAANLELWGRLELQHRKDE